MLSDVIARLAAKVPAFSGRVSGAAGHAEAMEHAPPLSRLPMAFVVPLADAAEPNTRIGEVCQRLHVHFGVVLVVGPAQADALGGPQAVAIEGLRIAVRTALLGWQPSWAETPITATQGQYLGLLNQALWWGDAFTFTITLRGTP